MASVREGRFGDKPARWIYEIAAKREDLSVEILDLKEYALPLFAEAVSPLYSGGNYRLPETKAWAQKIAEGDGFIVITPEYNHGYPASLKNSLDYLYGEWVDKPVAFVAYGSEGGARSVEQLRQVVVELRMAPIQESVHIRAPWYMLEKDGSLKAGSLDSYVESAENLLTQLTWWAKALKTARENSSLR